MASILDQLGGGGAPTGPAPGGPGGDAPQAGDGPDSPKVEDLIRQAIDLCGQAQQLEQDDNDTLAIQKAMTALQTVLGARQKADESAAGITPEHKAMSRAYQG